MYSFFTDEDFEVKDFEGCKKYIEGFIEALGKEKEKEDYNEMFSKMIDNEKKDISFESWTDIKLISYWYDYECIFLQGIAKFLEGRVEWEFESKDEAGYIDFENGECKITTGTMQWREDKPEDLMRDDKEITPELKKFWVMNKLR